MVNTEYSACSASVRLRLVAFRCLQWMITLGDIQQYSQACFRLDKVRHSKLLFKTTENQHARYTFMFASLLIPWPRSGFTRFFNSKIATVTPRIFKKSTWDTTSNNGGHLNHFCNHNDKSETA